jgi:hypothetical protein
MSPSFSASNISDILLVTLGTWTLYKLAKATANKLTYQSTSTALRAPPRDSWLYGTTLDFTDQTCWEKLEQWAATYGMVYRCPGAGMGGSRDIVMIMDPKAIAHVFAKETVTYRHLPLSVDVLETIVSLHNAISHLT